MHLVALVKPIPDLANLSISRGRQAVFEKSKRLLNPADESAVEAALALKAALGGPVTVLTVAQERDLEVLRKPLAMGADAAVAAVVDPALAEAPSGTGAIIPLLAAAIRKLAGAAGALVFCGPGSRSPGGSGQTGPRLAESLGWPCAVGVLAATTAGGPESIEIRERQRGNERSRRLPLPAVLIVDPAGFKPRAANALAIMKAVKRPIEKSTVADLGIDPADIETRLASLSTAVRQLAEEGP